MKTFQEHGQSFHPHLCPPWHNLTLSSRARHNNGEPKAAEGEFSSAQIFKGPAGLLWASLKIPAILMNPRLFFSKDETKALVLLNHINLASLSHPCFLDALKFVYSVYAFFVSQIFGTFLLSKRVTYCYTLDVCFLFAFV